MVPNGIDYTGFCSCSEDSVDDPVVEEEAAPSLRTASDPQNHRRPPRPYPGYGFRGSEQLPRGTVHPGTYEKPHHRRSADAELPAKLLRPHATTEKNLHDWLDRGRDWRRLRRHGHQRD